MKATLASLFTAAAMLVALACAGSEPEQASREPDTNTSNAATSAPTSTPLSRQTTPSAAEAPAPSPTKPVATSHSSTPARTTDTAPTQAATETATPAPAPTDHEAAIPPLDILRGIPNDPAAYPETIAHLNQLIDQHPDLTQAYLRRARIQTERREYEAALADLDHILPQRPRPIDFFVDKTHQPLADAFALRAIILARQGNVEHAVHDADAAEELESALTDTARTAIDISKGDYAGTSLSQWDYAKLGEYEAALQHLDRVAAESPDADLSFEYFTIHMRMRNWDEALPYLDDDIYGANQHYEQYLRAYIHTAAGRYDQALEHFERAIQLYNEHDLEIGRNPWVVEANYAVAFIKALDTKGPPDFEPLCNNEQSEKQPGYLPEACLGMEYLHYQLHIAEFLNGYHHDNPWLHMLRAYAVCPTKPDTTKHRYLAACADWIVAVNYERALELDPTISVARIGRAYARLESWYSYSENREQLAPYIAEALATDPDNHILHYRLSSYYRTRADRHLAIQHLTRTIELLPEEAAELTFQRGQMHFGYGDHDSARADFVKAHELGHPEQEVRMALSHLAR